MNLYTICDKNKSLIDLKSIHGIKFQDYSMDDYNKFIEVAKKHYVSRLYHWYETDLNDSNSGDVRYDYPIIYTNMVIKDNKLFGVLVKATGSYSDSEYYILEFNKKHEHAYLDGGYNVYSYDWWIKDKDLDNLDTLNASSNYALLYEKISYKDDKIYSYERNVIGFLQEDCIIKDGSIIGLSYKNDDLYEFIFSNKDSLIQKKVIGSNKYKTEINMKLVELNEKFLDMNITNITREDFKKGNYKMLDL